MKDVLVQKITSLQRCVARAREAHGAAGERFQDDFNLQDAALLNVIRACDAAIGLANMVVRQRRLGIPSESRESFMILAREKVIDRDMALQLTRMVGFRNLAVHQYTALDLNIVESVIRKDLDQLIAFADVIRGAADESPE